MKISGIYQITGPNNKIYIGSSVNIHARWQHHKGLLRRNQHANSKLQNAWNKYGESAFTFETIEIVSDATMLLQIEQKWLDTLFSTIPETKLYNIGRDARAAQRGRPSSRKGSIMSDDQKRKLSEAHLGKKRSEATKQKISRAMVGKKKSDATRAKMRYMKQFISDETRRKSSEAHKGISLTELHIRAKVRSFTNNRCVSFIDARGIIYDNIDNIAAFAKKHDLNRKSLNNIVIGKYHEHKGFKLYRKYTCNELK